MLIYVPIPTVAQILKTSFQGIMLVYDITNEKSFENIRNWIRNIEEVIRIAGLYKMS